MIKNKKYYIFSIVVIIFLQYAEIFSKQGFLLIMGPSGVGKSTIISILKQLDHRFFYISPFTTRSLRVGETDKIHMPLQQIQELEQEGKLLTVNQCYGIHYATPKYIIDNALAEGLFPILDWPIEKIDIMQDHYKNALFKVYIAPDDISELKQRLALDNRDIEGTRLNAGIKELTDYAEGTYDSYIDLKVINEHGFAEDTAHVIYRHFIDFLNR